MKNKAAKKLKFFKILSLFKKMDELFEDILNHISRYSYNKDISSLLSCCKKIWEKRFGVNFYDEITIREGYDILKHFSENLGLVERIKSVRVIMDSERIPFIPPNTENLKFLGLQYPGETIFFPKTLKKIYISSVSYKKTKNIFPHFVEHIVDYQGIFSSLLSQEVDTSFFTNLVTLNITGVNSRMIGKLPNTIKNLTIDRVFKDLVPSSVENLVIYFCPPFLEKGCIPESVRHLELEGAIMKTTGDYNTCFKGYLPNSLKSIKFSHSRIEAEIPEGVETIIFGPFFNQELDGLLPKSVKNITFGQEFDQPIDNLPPGITHLTFGRCFNHSIIGKIPPSVYHLELGYCFQRSISGALPNSLVHFHLHSPFCNFEKEDIPSSVKFLTLPIYFTDIHKIPNTVISITGPCIFDDLTKIPEWVNHVKADLYGQDWYRPGY